MAHDRTLQRLANGLRQITEDGLHRDTVLTINGTLPWNDWLAQERDRLVANGIYWRTCKIVRDGATSALFGEER